MRSTVDKPPLTPAELVTEVLHGIEVTDPYRWLEDQNSPLTRRWIEAQTGYTRAYFDSLAGREEIRARVSELLAVPSITSPWNVGNRYFFLRRHRDGEQPSIVMREGLFGTETVLVDPALHAGNSAIAVGIAAISHDARLLAYFVRHGGSDHAAIEVLDIDQGVVLPDRLPDGHGSGFAFSWDASGFYYCHRPLNDERPNYRAVRWHRLGTSSSQDQEVFFAGEDPALFVGIHYSPEERLLAYAVFRTGKNLHTSLYLQPMEPGSCPRILLSDIEGLVVPFFTCGELLAYTDFAARNFRIVRIDRESPDPGNWIDIVPESDQRIQQFAVARSCIFVTRTERFSTRIEAFGVDGFRLEAPPVPGHGSIDLTDQAFPSNRLLYYYTAISQPPTLYCYDPDEHDVVRVDQPGVPCNPSSIAVEEASYASKDGTLVPILLAARKDLLHTRPLPTFLTGYGGFGSCVTPRFTAFATVLIAQGFLVGVPALRGGSELGEEWHLSGKREKRQNAFDDFIAAAEWLVSQGISEGGRLAIGGGSNAGLLVGAAITQRPDLFRAAICLGPLLDMTRYHLFDLAAGWADEYGSPEDEMDFRFLLSYSPYHRVRDGAKYPAVLLISGDADTRCNPMHARKMAARLQAASTSGHPILLDYKSEWGHTPAQPLSRKVDSLTDRLAFICHELGVHAREKE